MEFTTRGRPAQSQSANYTGTVGFKLELFVTAEGFNRIDSRCFIIGVQCVME
jgi:hypothetical protein